MNLNDMLRLGFSNLWRMKLRSSLTILGVVIGIGALTSMVSFGTGMQKNIFDTVAANDLFTNITVTPRRVDTDDFDVSEAKKMADSLLHESKPLTDSTLTQIQALAGVEIAYPRIEFPVKVKLFDDSTNLRVLALPAALAKYKPYNDLLAGEYFSSDTTSAIIIGQNVLYRRFKIKLKDGPEQLTTADSARGVKLLPPDSILGKTIRVISISVNPTIMGQMLGSFTGMADLPLGESITELTVIGILKSNNNFGPNMGQGNLIIPIGTANSIPRLGFSNVWELLNKRGGNNSYDQIMVRAADMKVLDDVKKSLEKMNVGVYSISDQLRELRNAFLIINSILGAIGAIALIVAGLGIVNTMVMSILERTREIGIMKSIGGSEREIRLIFFVEASVIGFVGAILGLLLGWSITRVAGLIMNMQLSKDGIGPVELFYFPWWLILGAILFSIFISLAAGLYPAIRAANIDPVKALRHD